MSEPLDPDKSSSPPTPSPAERIRTREQATIYLQQIFRDFLLDNIQAWRLMVNDAGTNDATREELKLVVGQAEVLAKSLHIANALIASQQAAVVPVDQPLIKVPGSRLPGRG